MTSSNKNQDSSHSSVLSFATKQSNAASHAKKGGSNSNSKTITFFQAKLEVNQINDSYEREADRVAETVTESIYTGGKDQFFPPATPSSSEGGTVQRLAFFQRKPAFESPTDLDQNSANLVDVQRKSTMKLSLKRINPPPVQQQQEEESPFLVDKDPNESDHQIEPAQSEYHFEGGNELASGSEMNLVGGGLTPIPKAPVQRQEEETNAPTEHVNIQAKSKKVNLGNEVDANFETRLKSSKGRGKPLSSENQSQMESAFGADFSKVRVHTDANAATMNDQVAAHAFTHGSDIYFNKGKYRPKTKEGTNLLAHELTHVVQQGGASKTNVQRSAKATVNQTAPAMVQRGVIQEARDWAADKANNIPGYAMLTVILGFNPINGRDVPRNAANIFRGIMGFLPGGNLIWEALNNHGIFDKVGNWIVQKLEELGDIGASIVSAFKEFLNSLGLRDIFRLGSLWRRAKRIFTTPIKKIINFVKSLVIDILTFIRDAILRPLAVLAEGTRAWDLLIAVLGENPITGDPVPRNADTLIGGFMKLIGQEEIWENMKKGNAVARGWAWFQSALGQLIALVSSLPGRFIKTLKSLTITDLVLVPRAFAKIIGVFATFALDSSVGLAMRCGSCWRSFLV